VIKVVVKASSGGNENVAGEFVSDIEQERADAVSRIENLIKNNKVWTFTTYLSH